jgi:hypothetical protein
MNRREFVGIGATGLALSGLSRQTAIAQQVAGETLYNGIRLPAEWPPRRRDLADDPVTPPYLRTPPAVIPIDLGRQLFVDDFLIEATTLTRTHHRARSHANSPVLRPERPWEREGRMPMAMVFSDGVWYEPRERRFKMWYMGGHLQSVCLATSADGVRWERPDLGVRPGTNLVLQAMRDSTTVWLDHEAQDPRRRYVMQRSHREEDEWVQSIYFSADGIRWGERALRTAPTGDRTTMFYNPFRRVWVYSLRNGPGAPRRRNYWETRDLIAGPRWSSLDQADPWVGADRLDLMRDDLRVRTELYNVDCVAYESLLIGLFSIWRGDFNVPSGRPKSNDIVMGYSRDGFHWSRTERRAFIGVSERAGDWNWGNVQSAGGCCLVVGDELYFYHSGRAGAPGGNPEAGGSTGLAVLRRDGFVSMDAGETAGTLTTRPVRFAGSHLFVNAETANGELTAEVIGVNGEPLAGLTRAACMPVRGDRTKLAVTWRGADLAAAAGQPVRIRFHLRGGRFYAFWVSRHESGASQGYLAAGGPGLENRDV